MRKALESRPASDGFAPDHVECSPRLCAGDIDIALRPARLTWQEVEERASEAVLFGSRASGVAGPGSDWDFLFIGDGFSVHTHQVDIVWVSRAMVRSESWLESELASHVAFYGYWLFGGGVWRHLARVSPTTVARKQRALLSQLTVLDQVWWDLLPAARARHLRLVRREAQRYLLLRRGVPVPPTPHLDNMWGQSQSPGEDLDSLSRAVFSSV
jgi:hypothetical protein